jgi:hypothetical protein
MKINELTKFAITLAILPLIPAYILYKHSMVKLAIIVLVIFWILSFICFVSKKFTKIFKTNLEKLGAFLGKYIAIVVLTIVYLIAVVPTGLLMKVVKRDRLRLKKQNLSTYWLDYDNKNSDYEYQF